MLPAEPARGAAALSDPAAMRLLLQVWRQVGQHLEIATSLDAILPLVRARVPVDALGVLRWTPEADRLEGVALVPPGERPSITQLEGAHKAQVLAWLAAGQASVVDTTLREALDAGPAQGVLEAVPLTEGGAPLGALLAWSEAPRPDRQALLQALAEPLAVALRNDRRLQELARLREAAEADNRALRTRLARDELGQTVFGADAGLREVMTQVS